MKGRKHSRLILYLLCIHVNEILSCSSCFYFHSNVTAHLINNSGTR
jgi:hypothetical protein